MSSACICHTEEWCFYCEMYVPLEEERNKLLDMQKSMMIEIKRLSAKVVFLKNRLSCALDDLEEPKPIFRVDADGNLHRIEEE